MGKKSKLVKKRNNVLVNIIIIIGIIFLIASLVLMLTHNKNKDKENRIVEISYAEYKDIIKNNDYNIIILTTPTCIHCNNYKPSVNDVANNYDLIIYNLNVSTLKYDEYLELHDKYTATKDSYSSNDNPTILTPTTIITKNDVEIDSIRSDIGSSGFLQLLKKNNIIQ